MSNKILQIIKVDTSLVDEIKSSFGNLMTSDGVDANNRLRRFLKVKMQKTFPSDATWPLKNYIIEPMDDSNEGPQQVEAMKKRFPNFVSKIQLIDNEFIESNAMYELLCAFYDAFELDNEAIIDVHQMRIMCVPRRGTGDYAGAAHLSPQGWHQDGFNYLAIIGMGYHNVIGGEVMVSDSQTNPPFMKTRLEPGTMLLVKDDYLWHNADTIQPLDPNKDAYVDIILLSTNK